MSRLGPGVRSFQVRDPSRVISLAMRSDRWLDEASTMGALLAPVVGALPSSPSSLSGSLFDGSAGIALFLVELFGRTGEVAHAEAWRTVLAHALEQAGGLPAEQLGVYSGRLGAVYVATRATALTGELAWTKRARALLMPVAVAAKRERGLDVLAGSAGAIPLLLRIADAPGIGTLAHDIALALGERLISRAQRETRGWSWPSRDVAKIRNHTGFGHGALGMGVAFSELFGATGLGAFQYAAGQALAYERQFFDPALGNVLDVRHHALARYLGECHATSRDEWLSADLPRYRPSYRAGWCFGTAGAAVGRLSVARTCNDSITGAEGLSGLATTLDLLPRTSDLSMLHGLSGMCDLLIIAATYDVPAALSDRTVDAVAVTARRLTEAPHAVLDAGFMRGSSGVGFALLRMGAPAIPSLLAPAPRAATISSCVGRRGEHMTAVALEAADVRRYFSRTLRALRAPYAKGASPIVLHDVKATGSAAAAYAALKMHPLLQQPLTADRALAEAWVCDRHRFEAADAECDRTGAWYAMVRRMAMRHQPDAWRYVVPESTVCLPQAHHSRATSRHQFVLYRSDFAWCVTRATPPIVAALNGVRAPSAAQPASQNILARLCAQGLLQAAPHAESVGDR